MIFVKRKENACRIGILFLLLLFFFVQSSISKMIVQMFVPSLIYMDSETQKFSLEEAFTKLGTCMYPLFGYVEKEISYMTIVEDENTYEKLLELEGTDEERDEVLEDVEPKKDAEKDQNLLKAAMENENKIVQDQADGIFQPGGKKVVYQRETLRDFKELVEQFYAIDKTTMTNEQELQIDKLLDYDMRIEKNAEQPQILIYHTHASEGYADSIQGDLSTTVIGAGEQLKNILESDYGYKVLHDTGIYDTVRAQAYNVAAPNLERILQENESIEVVIDLHRDQVPEGTKLVQYLNGIPTAKFMFFNGLSRTKETGQIGYLENPNIDCNLAFAFQMQYLCNEFYPELTRKIYLKGYRYNMHYKGKTLLIELGAQTNTIAEAKNACYPIAQILDLVLCGKVNE